MTIEYNNNIKLSVTVTTYNHGDMLRNCINSILSQVTNFYFEVIVSDDASYDFDTKKILEEFKKISSSNLFIIEQPINIGPIKNYFDVVGRARGKYIAYIDGDDIMLPGKLQAQVDILDNNLDCSVVFHKMDIVPPTIPDKLPLDVIIFDAEEWLKKGCFLPHSSKMYRSRSIITKDGARPTVDFLLHIEHSRGGRIYYINHCLGIKCFHDEMITKNLTWRPYLYEAHERAYDRAIELGYNKELSLRGKIKFRQGVGLSLLNLDDKLGAVQWLQIENSLREYASFKQKMLSAIAIYPFLLVNIQKVRHRFKSFFA